MRTAPESEEEIRIVFSEVGKRMKEKFPNIFDDYQITVEDSIPYYHTINSKV